MKSVIGLRASFGRSTLHLYERLFGGTSTPELRDRSRAPHWWVPCAVNHALHSLGCPLGDVVARRTIELRRQLGSTDLKPKVLLRVDDYPHWTVPTDLFWQFHAILAEQRLDYLLAVTPFLASRPLSPQDQEPRPFDQQDWSRLAGALAQGELEIGLHGATHQTLSRKLPSEFDSLALDKASARISRAWDWLCGQGMTPLAFVPPFNRFPLRLWSALPSNCKVLCLGPESLHDVPLVWSPAAHDGRTIVFSLRPFYGRATEILERLAKGRWLEVEGSIVPITLHWTWEVSDRFAGVSKLARYLGGFTTNWDSLRAGLS